MNLRNLALGIGLTSLVTVGSLAPSMTRAQESKAPVTEVINNKGLDSDKFEMGHADSSKTAELLEVLQNMKDSNSTQNELFDEILGKLGEISENNKSLGSDSQKTAALLETLEAIINNLESDVVQAEQPSGMQKGFDKLVKSVGLEKVQKYVEDADSEQLVSLALLMACLGIGGASLYAMNKCNKLDADDYQKDYKAQSSLDNASSHNEINEAYNYITDKLDIKSDEEFKELLKLPNEEFEKELFNRLEKNKNN